MSGWFYRALIALSRALGLWVVSGFARLVAAGYFVFAWKRRARSLRFYRALFPESSALARLGLSWRQFQGFACLFAERLRLDRGERFTLSEEGWGEVERAAERGQGAVLLMSHLGDWEMAARLLSRKGSRIRLMLFVGERAGEGVERIQKRDLQRDGIELVVAREGDEGAAFESLEALAFIRSGGLVSFAGDRLWHAGQKPVEVVFAGERVRLPAGPHLFALASGAPVFTFFALRTAKRSWKLVIRGPRLVEADARDERWGAVQASAQAYALELEAMARARPADWFHFEPFLGE
ncbi:MAG: lysophospholipid acyltransferase family protein [Deltaproteobacteria bacterium]|nr:lysophospholipid acyltransferase family protein [Deltaproteobacteria bacterium]